jgi:hypothetical protein
MYETTVENTLLIISNSYISIQGRTLLKIVSLFKVSNKISGRGGRDRMVVGFIATCVISA